MSTARMVTVLSAVGYIRQGSAGSFAENARLVPRITTMKATMTKRRTETAPPSAGHSDPRPRKDSMRLYIFWISTIMAASLDDEVHQQCYIEHLLNRVLCGGPHASNVVRGIVTTGCC